MEGGPPSFEQDFTCPVLLRCHRAAHGFRLRGSNPLWRTFPSASANPLPARVMVLQPHPAYRMVWALPRSLAATEGISFDFFSSGYLDVSVPRVRLLHLCIQCKIPVKGGFPHSDISGSKSVCRLPEAYRSLPRPSSLPGAKASALCPFHLTSSLSSPWNPQRSALDPLLFSKGSALLRPRQALA